MLVALVALTLLATAVSPAADAQVAASGLRILSRDGTRTLPTVIVNNQDYVALDEVATMFGLAIREDRLAGGVTITGGTDRPIILTADQNVVSVAGRLVSLNAPPIRQDNRWLLPLDFLQRALGPALDTRMELRRAARLLVMGDLRVPRVNARVETPPGRAVVVFDITPATPVRVAQEPGRLLVTFEADVLDLNLPQVAAEDFVQSVQPGEAPATVHIVPGPRFGLHRATTSQPDAGSSRLTIELLPSATEAPAAPTPAPSDPAAPTPAPIDPIPAPSLATGVRTVVIDPGHGGDDAGARGANGTLEKDVTLAVARRLRTMIEGRLGLRVFLTREDDRMLSLDDRAAYANSQKADVFVSIHANAGLRQSMQGAEVYYLRLDPAEMALQRGARARDTQLPALGGMTRSIGLVPWDVAQAAYLDQSSMLAGLIEQALSDRVEVSDRPVQQAPLRVLVGASMPAVLVEIGYLSNPAQERALASAAYQDRVAQALFNAIVQFRARAGSVPAEAVKPQ